MTHILCKAAKKYPEKKRRVEGGAPKAINIAKHNLSDLEDSSDEDKQ